MLQTRKRLAPTTRAPDTAASGVVPSCSPEARAGENPATEYIGSVDKGVKALDRLSTLPRPYSIYLGQPNVARYGGCVRKAPKILLYGRPSAGPLHTRQRRRITILI